MITSDIKNADEYVRKVDKSQIPTCNIMGVNIAAINMEWLLEYLEKNIDLLHGDYICVSNVHTTVTSFEEPDYCAVQNGGIMAIPDGGPLSTVGRKRGYKNMERTTGPSLMGKIFKVTNEKGYRHFFYGSKQETLDLLEEKLKVYYPGIQIAGMYSPPFRPLTKEEDKAVIKMINAVKPDFVWIGLGAPKQEKWMAEHQGKIDGLMIGVGAGFDYYAGNIQRAPQWMQKWNLEWMYRLIQDPKRLFYRYWHTNTKFILNAVIRRK
ncbi:WecB/TagA/CpsF family glycosyltransferase [Enterococcus faecium]|uniref:WecB/TagA/CpsF family glycosyltransferase n=1 Tax=Enterococcus faecium TaxID=1352 RepID=UPI0002A2A701|nr:WecB/TagA/CpsF family glycosyltransferase [Enterococcus faecium]ELB21484.1 WecB/TagA/CpsF family glycosyl transferase [Enterococcus faecium EnGen0035]EMF0318510.1 WecB/TagA/CpsF family glycosyltransferase [Enterococcus faecium]NTJ29729.1 WecB/TagA/CpsF family glycosyltransferase [Enterococcus faecium]TNW95329.1 WecB/TagA/CpsF family glycosyltransferase [Enterococcus faecium]